MRNWMIAAAALCIGPAASAQDGGAMPPAKEAPKDAPAAKHENKITPAAKAAFEKCAALLYSPLKGGLKDLNGAVKMVMEAGEGGGEGRKGRMGAMGKMELTFAVAFKAPADLKVEWKDVPAAADGQGAGGEMAARMAQMRKGMADGMNLAVTRILRSTIEGFIPASDTEFDADVKVENGVSTLLLTHYLDGVETSREEVTLDANGIPSVMVSTPRGGEAAPAPGAGAGRGPRGMGGADGKSTVKFTYAKEGDLFRLDKMTMDSRAGPMEATLDYADAGAFKVVRSWELAPAGGAMKFGFKFSELTVNGKVVNLGPAAPAVPAPEGKDAPKPGEDAGGKKGE